MAGAAYTYDHDAEGNQVTASKDGAVTNRTQWDPNAPLPILASEYDSAWALKQSYRYDPLGQPTATATGTGSLFYYHHDTQGSPVDVTGNTGTLYQRWSYDSFGTRVLATATSGAPASTPSYTGARYEATTGNLDLHARQYNTGTGRFTRPDPATRDQATPYVSPYAYADNTPSLLTDPSGLTPADPDDEHVHSLGQVLGIFGNAFVDVFKSPFVFMGDVHDAFTGENGGAGGFVDKYLPIRPAYRLYRAESMLRDQGCDALADLYADAAEELTQQIAVTGIGGLTGWRRDVVEPNKPGRFGPGAAHGDDPALGGANPYVPRGFSAAEYGEFAGELYSGLRAAGYSDSTAIFQGSSVTGQSFKTGEPFRAASDYDIALAGASLLEQAKKAGVGLRSGGTRTGPLREIDLRKMRLSGLAAELSRKAGREVHFMIYDSMESAIGRAPSMIVPRK